MTVERADFDDLVTLVTQAPPWEKDRAAGVRILLRAIGEGKANAPDQILQRWTWKLARATRKVQDRRASAEFPEAKRLLGAVANSRGHRHEENVQKLVQVAKALPLDVGAALLASAEGYTPRANSALDRGARGARRDHTRSRTRSPTTCPRRRRRRASRAAASGRRRPASGQAQRAAADGRRAERDARTAPPPSGGDGGSRGRSAPAPAPQAGRRRRRRPSRPPPRRRIRTARKTPATTVRRCWSCSRSASSRGRHGALAVRAAGAADRARRRRDRPAAARDRRRASSRASPSSRSSPPGCSTCSGCRRTCCATSRSRCSSLVALTLLVPRFGELARAAAPVPDPPPRRRPRRRLPARRSLGLVFVPCAGPGARRGDGDRGQPRRRARRRLLTLAYALGAAVPMLAIAFAGQRAAPRLPRQRA